jgi:hypothetical protein
VGDGSSGTLNHSGWTAEIKCFHHPDFKLGDESADFALCKTTGVLFGLSWYENVGDESFTLGTQQPVHLLGFGCTDDSRVGGDLYEGSALIVAAPQGSYFTQTSGAAVCEGDSGGGAFAVRNNNVYLIGVNAWAAGGNYSLLSTTAIAGFTNWARSWAAGEGVVICGLHSNAQNCRGWELPNL